MRGGAIFNQGTLTIGNSYLRNNTGKEGGAIRNHDNGLLTFQSSTISGNTATGTNSSGGISSNSALTIQNSTISGNFATKLHLLTNRPKTNSDLLRVIKGLTAHRLIDYLKENNYERSLKKLEHQQRDRNYKYSLWQTEKNVFQIDNEKTFMQKLNYIHNNPVRAGLVDKSTNFRWSSARIWAGCPVENEPLLLDKDAIYWRRSEGRART